MQVEVKGRLGSLSESVSKVHFGGKFALGADFELTDNVVMFTQAEYSIYNSRNYSGLKVDYDETAGRIGLMYRF